MRKFLTTALVLTVLGVLVGPAAGSDYLNLSAGAAANPGTTIGLSWDGVDGGTYKVEWKKSSGGTWSNSHTVDQNSPDVQIGSGFRFYYLVGNLSCGTSYSFRVKRTWKAWKEVSAATSDCGSMACPQIAVGNLVLNSSANHVFFTGTDRRVYNHWWDNTSLSPNKWRLDALGPAQIAAGNPVLNSSADHVFFIGTDQRVYNYWWNGGWQFGWLGSSQIAAQSLVVSSSGDHVFFIGTDQRVYNYSWNININKYQLDALGPAQIAAGNLVRLVLNSSADHVFFIGTDKRVYNYWWDNASSAGNKWRLDALDYSAPAAIATGNLVLSPSAGNVFFIGTDKRVYNHWWDGSTWHLNALDYNAPKIAAGNLALNSSGDKVFFIGTDKLVYNHWWDGSTWHLNALDYNAPKIAAGNPVSNSSGDHVFFIGTDKRVYNHWWNIDKYRLDPLCP